VQAGRRRTEAPAAVRAAGLHLGTESEDLGSEMRVGMAWIVPRRSMHWAATAGLVFLSVQ
jgi:hypothetical protein